MVEEERQVTVMYYPIYPEMECYSTGIYTDDCDCDHCSHKGDCSSCGQDDDDEYGLF